MKYLTATFKISCPEGLLQAARDLLADGVADAGFESFEDTADGLRGYVQESLLDRGALDAAIADFPLEGTTVTYSLAPAEDKDWNEAWEEAGFDPINIDDKIIIEDANKPLEDNLSDAPTANGNHKSQISNLKSQSNKAQSSMLNAQRIKIAARLAFGTGTHETTRMIVSTLLGLDLKGKQVLDCGCGTGILGIVASKLGASGVVGYDIDSWSVENTRHNAELNGVDNLQALLGDASVIASIDGSFDVVIANINRNILLNDMPAMCSKLKDNGLLILSGFYTTDIPLLEDKASNLGLKLESQRSDNDWCSTLFRRQLV